IVKLFLEDFPKLGKFQWLHQEMRVESKRLCFVGRGPNDVFRRATNHNNGDQAGQIPQLVDQALSGLCPEAKIDGDAIEFAFLDEPLGFLQSRGADNVKSALSADPTDNRALRDDIVDHQQSGYIRI